MAAGYGTAQEAQPEQGKGDAPFSSDYIAQYLKALGGDIWKGITFGGPDTSPKPAADPKKAPAKAKAKATTPAETPAQIQAAEQAAIAANPFNQMGQGLVADEKNLEAPLENAMSGGLTAPGTSNAVATALSAAGLSPGSPAAQWLNANISQANAADAPMAQAMQQYGQAFGQGDAGVQSALANMGQANALANTVAPEQQWLQSLATHIQSNLNYYGTIPNWAVGSGSQALPPALQYYLQQTGTGQATGTTPLQNITVPGAPKTKAGANPLGNVSIPSTAGAVPSALSAGTGAAPG
jgi:hypothetical protein